MGPDAWRWAVWLINRGASRRLRLPCAMEQRLWQRSCWMAPGRRTRTHSSCHWLSARLDRCWPKRGAKAMKFDTPATTNPIDQLKVVGKPVDRIDGPLKTTGAAPYAYEHDAATNPAYGYIVGSAIAKGRIASMDL